MYESKSRPPIPRRHFVRRMAVHFAGASALVLASLVLGMLGYEHFERLPWRDAFLNSAMLLGGMGPVDMPQSPNGKLFAGIYALYSGLVFLVTIALLSAPVLHRLLHKVHWEEE